MAPFDTATPPARSHRDDVLFLAGLTPLIGLLGALLVGALGAAATEYARPFGLTAEEAGFGQLRLASILTLLAVLVALAASSVTAGVFTHRLAKAALASTQDENVGVLRLVGLGILASLILIVLGLALVPSTSGTLVWRVMVYGAGLGTLTGSVSAALEPDRQLARWTGRLAGHVPDPWRRAIRTLGPLLVVVLVAWAGLRTVEAGTNLATQVLETGRLDTTSSWDEVVADVLALQAVPVQPVGKDPALGCAVLIARFGGTAWVLAGQPEGGRPRALPRSVVEVAPRLDGDVRACWADTAAGGTSDGG